MPIYNVDKFLCRCIDSILSQTYTNFELLLIDDGSTDKSGIVSDNYAAKDSRVHALHKKNGGVSSARNVGIENASGEYICFIDADDYVESHYLQNFIEILDERDDLFIQGVCFDYGDENYVTSPMIDTRGEGNYKLVEWFEKTPNIHNGYIFHKLYKRSIINSNGIRFDENISFAEDGLFNFQYLARSRRYVMTSKTAYHYCIRKGSLTWLGKNIPIKNQALTFGKDMDVLLSFDVPIDDKAHYEMFIKHFAWRILSAWVVWPVCEVGASISECDSIMRKMISSYALDKVQGLPKRYQILKNIFGLENRLMRCSLLYMLFAIRNIQNRIKRKIIRK